MSAKTLMTCAVALLVTACLPAGSDETTEDETYRWWTIDEEADPIDPPEDDPVDPPEDDPIIDPMDDPMDDPVPPAPNATCEQRTGPLVGSGFFEQDALAGGEPFDVCGVAQGRTFFYELQLGLGDPIPTEVTVMPNDPENLLTSIQIAPLNDLNACDLAEQPRCETAFEPLGAMGDVSASVNASIGGGRDPAYALVIVTTTVIDPERDTRFLFWHEGFAP